MAGKKYNYEDTMQLLFDAYNNNEKVDYATVESTLGLEYSIADKEHKATTRSAVYELRKLLRSEYNLLLKNAASASCQGPEYHYFTVVDIKAPLTAPITPKIIKSPSPVFSIIPFL